MVDTSAAGNLHLTSGRLLARNTIWNLLGQIIPIFAGIVTIPIIVRGLGVERFGILSLAWVVVGYFSLFDLGIGRALTKFVADKLGAGEVHEIPSLAWTALLLMFVLGVVGTLIIAVISPWLVYHALKVSQPLQPETLRGFYWLAASIPIVTTTAGFRGLLEALQRFRVVNMIRIPMSIFSFVAPVLVLPFSHSLVPVLGTLVAARFVGCGVHVWACFRAMPTLYASCSLKRSAVMPLAKFGGWMTVNNVVGPLLSYIDRFLVGALTSITSLAYYTTPVDAVLRLTVIPGAVVGVLFPAFAMSIGQDVGRAGVLLSRGVKYIFLVIFPLVLIIVTFAPEGLRLWLGPTFSQNGAAVLRLAAAGVFVNAIAVLPFNLIQSAGRPDLTAWLITIELPLYWAALWFFTRRMGIEGTAIVWASRMILEGMVIFLMSQRLLPQSRKFLSRLGTAIAGGLVILYCGGAIQITSVKVIFVAVILAIFGIAGWYWGLLPAEREYLARY
jgi:O-antigen/teichoic acid export membrane protein